MFRDIMMKFLAMHLSLETLVLIGSIVDSTLVSIGIDQLIVSSHLVSITMFRVLLYIACFVILDAILEIVFGMRIVMIVMVTLIMMGCLLMMMIMVIVMGNQVHGGVTGCPAMERSGLYYNTGQQGKCCDYLNKILIS